jgi:hypothetical protein
MSGASSSRFEIRPLQDLYHYQIDAVDENWLADSSGSSKRSKKPKLSAQSSVVSVTRKNFLECMNSLEVECYKVRS